MQPAAPSRPLGIGRTFQNLALFRTMSVRDNVMVGGHCRSRSGFIANAFRLPIVAAEERSPRSHQGLLEARTRRCRGAGQRAPLLASKRVELARALASEPKLLLLDEPAAGLNHEELGDSASSYVEIRDRFGITVLLVEHHMSLVMRVSDQVVALDFGKQDRRRHARRSPAASRRHPRLSRGRLMAAMLEVHNLDAAYGRPDAERG